MVVDNTKWRGRRKVTLDSVVQKDLGFVCWTSPDTMLLHLTLPLVYG